MTSDREDRGHTFEASTPHPPCQITTVQIHSARIFRQAFLKRESIQEDSVVERRYERRDGIVSKREVISGLRQRFNLPRKVQILDVIRGTGGDC